jgi:hypothetical protein
MHRVKYVRGAMPYTDRQIEVLAKAHWEAENDVWTAKRATLEAEIGSPLPIYAWRDDRLPAKIWETRMEMMRFALTEMEMECATSSHSWHLPR